MISNVNSIGNVIIPIVTVFTVISGLFGLKKLMMVRSISMNLISIKGSSYSDGKVFKNWLARHRLNRKILIFLSLIVFSLLFYLFFGNFIFSLFLTICSIIFILDFIGGIDSRRKDLLHNQLIEFVNNMIIMLKAGKTVRNIFKDSVNWSKKPLKKYLKKMVNELELNFTMDEALDRFALRCDSREIKLLVSALKINNKIGGDLIIILSNINDTLQYSLKAKSQIRTMTLQSKYSGNIISFFPIFVLIALYIFMNDTVRIFFSSSLGSILLLVGGSLEIAGIIVIKKILNIGR